MRILVTGGAGYIGSHICVELLNAEYEIIVADNFTNSQPQVLNRVKEMTNQDFLVYELDLLNRPGLERIFSEHAIDAVIHLAGLKAVGESVHHPTLYYHNNLTGTLLLCEVMQQYGVKKMVFSSSATVYGNPNSVPISEDAPLQATNPYGRTKLMIENILNDLYVSDNEWNITILRYFNPIGAHPSGIIGEAPRGIPNNLMPYITQVAIGMRKQLYIFGNDYNTHDGTPIRDYIHVVDLARGHVNALQRLGEKPSLSTYNLGTGKGYSVLDLVKSFEKVTRRKIPLVYTDRRLGDIEQCFADPSNANKELNWWAEKSIEDMCHDSWNWELNRPKLIQS
jgi:UDP-glucose 4-epimerase